MTIRPPKYRRQVIYGKIKADIGKILRDLSERRGVEVIVGEYEGAIREYIQNQLQEDIANDQISIKEYIDPFTGEREK